MVQVIAGVPLCYAVAVFGYPLLNNRIGCLVLGTLVLFFAANFSSAMGRSIAEALH